MLRHTANEVGRSSGERIRRRARCVSRPSLLLAFSVVEMVPCWAARDGRRDGSSPGQKATEDIVSALMASGDSKSRRLTSTRKLGCCFASPEEQELWAVPAVSKTMKLVSVPVGPQGNNVAISFPDTRG